MKTNETKNVEAVEPQALKKETMQTGVKYRGYGILNEYKEFMFIPENTGAHAGRERVLYENEGFQIKQTKNRIIIRVSLENQSNKLEYIKGFADAFNNFTKFIKTHEI